MDFEGHLLAEIHATANLRTFPVPDILESSALVWNSADLLKKLFSENDGATQMVPRLTRLIQRGLDLNVTWKDSVGQENPALYHALNAKSSGWALALLEIDPSLADGQVGQLAMRVAVRRAFADVVTKLIAMHVSVESPSDDHRGTLLTHACDSSHTAIAEILLKAGAQVNARNSNGDTALHRVGVFTPDNRMSSFLCTKLLLSHGADTTARNKQSITAFEALLFRNDLGTITALILYGNILPGNMLSVTSNAITRETYARAYLLVMHQVVRAEMATIRDGTQSNEVRRKMRLDAKAANMLDLRTVPYHMLPGAIDAFAAHVLSPSSHKELKALRNALLCTLRELAEVIHESPDGRAEAAELCDKDTKSYETKRRKTKK
jgi:hypothetical protein